MKALIIRRFGGPDVLELAQVADPVAGADEVLVRIRASALNRADILQRRGLYPAPADSPADIPGLEFAGEVVSRGARVCDLEPGDRVMGILGGGGQAEKVALHERLCLPVPPGLTFEQAAAVPEAFLTAYDALFLRGHLTAGVWVLLHAAASGVGTAALQVARAAGARVVALSRSPEKRRRLQELGADRVLDPGSDGLPELIRQAASGPVDLVVDFLGKASWDVNLDVLGTGGRLVLVGTLGGSRVEADLSVLMRKRLTVVGTVLRARPLEEKIALVQGFRRQMLPLLADGRLRPIIDRSFPLEEAATAHAVMERNQNFGKIVLRIP